MWSCGDRCGESEVDTLEAATQLATHQTRRRIGVLTGVILPIRLLPAIEEIVSERCGGVDQSSVNPLT